MLQYLKISNLALLEEAEIDFEQGFTVITGETGAGKSVILGALSLLSGSRTDKAIIRTGSQVCEVEASLWLEDARSVNAILAESGLPMCEEGALLLKRSIHLSKPSRVFVNGSAATLATLQAIGECWIDFHGPGEPQRLLKPECQLELIDLFAKLDKDRDRYARLYGEWRNTLGQIDRLRNETQLAPDQIDFLKTQIARIDSLELSDGAIERLETDFNRVTSAQDLLEQIGLLSEGLTGEEGALSAVSGLSRAASEATEMDPSLAELEQRLENAIIEIQEIGAEYDHIGETLNFEPEFAAEVQERMVAWQELRRKYGRDPSDALAARDEMLAKMESQGDIEGTLEKLNTQADGQEVELKKLAARLTQKRRKAGESLASQAESILLELGFKKGSCGLQMVPENGLRSFGDALPELMFSPNVGEPLQPLAKIASSGELARVMLALKSILAEVDDVPVLVFDEVDANVGGEIGRVVGEKMRTISEGHQVFCITHLPQVASLGEHHYLVEKDQSGARASVSIGCLEAKGEERVSELARMLGDREANAAVAHAKELLAV